MPLARLKHLVLFLAGLPLIACAGSRLLQKPVTNLACYYGYGRLEELARYDLVVLQPFAYNPEDIAFLQSRGTRVLGYISVGEDDELKRDNGRGPGGYAPWYVDEFTGPGTQKPGPDGIPDTNADWGSYYVDPSHPRWQRHLKERLKQMRKYYGFDGIFVDTVLIPQNVFTQPLEDKMQQGMKSLIQNLRRWWKSGYILLNNGWQDLESWKNLMDGLMIENFAEHHQGEMERLARHIRHVRNSQGFRWDVFTLDYLPRSSPMVSQARALSRSYGFVPVVYEDTPAGRALKTLPLPEEVK